MGVKSGSKSPTESSVIANIHFSDYTCRILDSSLSPIPTCFRSSTLSNRPTSCWKAEPINQHYYLWAKKLTDNLLCPFWPDSTDRRDTFQATRIDYFEQCFVCMVLHTSQLFSHAVSSNQTFLSFHFCFGLCIYREPTTGNQFLNDQIRKGRVLTCQCFDYRLFRL